MNHLIQRIDTMVSLFEEASKQVTQADNMEDRINDLTKQLEMLLEQNKQIARGLILLEKYVRGRSKLESMAPSFANNGNPSS